MSEEVYYNVDDHEKSQIIKLLEFLSIEVRDTGGDGDAIWYSKNYSIDHIFNILNVYNFKCVNHWKREIETNPKGQRYIFWGEGQEGIIITNSKDLFDSRPFWQQISIEF